jgi:hypothetical protein
MDILVDQAELGIVLQIQQAMEMVDMAVIRLLMVEMVVV